MDSLKAHTLLFLSLKTITNYNVQIRRLYANFCKFTICTSPIIQFVYPPNFCIAFVFHFPWVLQSSQGKLKTVIVQNFGGQTRVIMGEAQSANESTQSKRRFCFKSGQHQNRQNAHILTQIRKQTKKKRVKRQTDFLP